MKNYSFQQKKKSGTKVGCYALAISTIAVMMITSAKKTIAQEAQNLNSVISVDKSYAKTFFFKKIKVIGSTVFSLEELSAIVAPFENKYLRQEELLELRSAITNLYIKEGYLTSGAFLPPQDISDGELEVQVIEGQLENIQIKGLTHLNPNYVRDRLRRFTTIPLNINDLEDALKLLQLNPLFDSVNASLETGSSTDESVLVVNLTEAPPLGLSFSVDNSLPPNIGSINGNVAISEINLLGFGDSLDLSYDLSEGLSEFNAAYTIPINALDGTISIAYQNQQNSIIEEPFQNLGINAKYNKFSLSYRQPIVNTPSEEFAVGLSFFFKENKTFIFDNLPFSFSPQAKNGETRVRTLNFTQEWLYRSAQRILAAHSSLSFGLDLFEATSDSFFLWLGQVQWLEKLNNDIIVVTQLAAQLTPDKLLPIEQFTIGGVYTVRGYPRDFRIGDNGVVGSVEARFTIVRDENFGELELTPFFDIGTVWNNAGDIPSPSTLASLGIQIGWFKGDFKTTFSYGIPLIPIENGNNFDSNFDFRVEWKILRF